MSYSYTVLEHPADIKLKIEADTKEEIFLGALKGMAEILAFNEDLTSQKVERKIKVSSVDFSSLLVDFLSEVLTLTDINDSVFKEMDLISLKDNEIEAIIKGFKVKKFKEEIKAVTYHQLEIKEKENKKWEAVVLFDV